MTEAAWAVGASAAVLIGVLFCLHWRRSGDRFFLYFAAAFWVLGASETIQLAGGENETRPAAYIVRLLAFLLIIGAIVSKNRHRADAHDRLDLMSQADDLPSPRQ